MDSRFWCAFVAGLCILQAIYSMLFGNDTMAWIEMGLAIWNIWLYTKVKEAEDAERTTNTGREEK